VATENWQVLLKDHHPGYISWEQYLENQRILKSNRTKSHDVSSGAAKKGSALRRALNMIRKNGGWNWPWSGSATRPSTLNANTKR